jgi:chemosensory pili system protein ChpA (sensor histidine kinase/response regulator)
VPSQPGQQQLALVAELGRQHVAFVVDGIVGDREVVVRALPRHLHRRAVRGAAVTPTGGVLLVLDVPQLLHRMRADGSLPGLPTPPVPRLVPAPKPRILVVDDSLTIRQSVVSALTHAGYDPQTAHDGMEALEMLLESIPALVVLDIEMPRLDGYELLSVMRGHAQLKSVPVVMLTSRGAQRHRQYAESLGADAYLVKPCPDDDLLATIRQLLHRA